MDWSYELLSADEQQVLRRLSLFAGGASLDAVADVCADGDENRAAELLGRLVDASLVRAEAGEHMRYRLLETVRQYGAARLAGDADVDDVRRQHAEHYLAVAEAANLALDSLGHGPQHHAPVLLEQHNLRAALDWASGVDVELAARLMVALENFWVSHALPEAIRRFEQLRPYLDELDVVLRARMLRDHAACLDVLEKFEAAQPLYERSRELFRQAGDAVAVAHLDFRVGVVILHRGGDRELVLRLWESSLQTCRREDDRIGELQLLANLGRLELASGNRVQARAMIEQSVEVARDAGWPWWQVGWLCQLADIAFADRRLEQAESHGREALSVAVEMGNRHYVRYALAVLARAAALRGDDERALLLWATVEAAEAPPGRFGHFDRAAYAAAMPDRARPEPLALDDAVAIVLD
jgi:tetratricopeptide (TPR) repeat protein